MSQRASSKKSAHYVPGQRGFSILLSTVLVAAVLGLGTRIYFNPERIRGWISEALAAQPTTTHLKFEKSDLILARGAWPQLAIRISQVEIWPTETCQEEPGLRISELHIPLRLWSLFRGQVQIGTVYGQKLALDVQALKNLCHQAKAEPAASTPTIAQSETVAQPLRTPARHLSGGSIEVPTWISASEIQNLQSTLTGVYFDRVEIQLERGTKTLILEDLDIRTQSKLAGIHLSTNLRLPPEMTYFATIPAFSVEVELQPETAELSLRGNLNEGNIEGHAQVTLQALKPYVEATFSAQGVPLSTLVPVLKKQGYIQTDLQPHFMWLSCSAAIKGHLHRLFDDNPLKFHDCKIDGEPGRVSFANAERHPDGTWQPMQLEFAGIDLKKTMGVFAVEGPSGVVSEFGRLDGILDFTNLAQADFNGSVRGLQIFFSNQSVSARQEVTSFATQISLRGQKVSGVFEKFILQNGEALGHFHFALNLENHKGDFDAALESVILDPSIQRLMVNGELGQMVFHGKGQFETTEQNQVPVTWSGEAQMKGLSSASLGIPLAKFKSEYKNDHLSLVAQIPELSLHQSSSFYKNAKVILMGHETEGEWLKAHDFSARLGFSDAGLQWEKASATCENAKIAWSSAGSLDRERKLKGWVMADFPLVKKLRWDLQGQALEPEFNAALLNLKKLGNRPIDDVILGLSKAGQFKQATAKEVPEQSEIGRFSRSVLEKAKGIIDLSSPANAEEKQPPAPVASETSLNAVPESQDQEKPEDETPENTSEK